MEQATSSPKPSSGFHLNSIQKAILILGVIISIILFAFYIYAIYISKLSYNEVARQAKIAEEEMQRIEQGRALSITAGWKTYRNEELGFEVKHPEDWKIKDMGPIDYGNGRIEVGFQAISPSRYDLPNYQGLEAYYFFSAYWQNGILDRSSGFFVAPSLSKSGHELPDLVFENHDQFVRSMPEYKISQQIFSTFRFVR